MMKHLLIGASALVLTTVAAQAQTVNPRVQSSATAVEVKLNGSVPIQTNEQVPYDNAVKSATSKANASSARSSAEAAFDVPGSGIAGYYNAAIIAGGGDVLPGTAAGNKSAIDTNGNNNEAIVDQRGGYNGWAAVRQQGNINQADIDQDDTKTGSGTANAASIQQISSASGAGAFTQKAEINQVHTGGSGQNAAILQGGVNTGGGLGGFLGSDNSARIDQHGGSSVSGVLNDSSIVQTAQSNTGYIQQGTETSQTRSSHAAIQQRTNDNAGIYQTGQTNSRAYVYQGAGYTKADVVQSGSNGQNFAAVNQEADSTEARLTSFISQSGGSNNSAFVAQTGATMNGYAEIFQAGSDNVALVAQTTSPTSNAQISQSGNGNYAATYQ